MSIHSDILEYCMAIDKDHSAIIVPSTLYSYSDGGLHINGPNGVVRLLENSEAAVIEGFIKAGSLVSGARKELDEVVTLLKEPDTSRTVSYLLCSATTCGDVIQDINDLKRAKILIVGCGGIGSAVVLLLAGCGIRNFKLIDQDIVERSNLNRQLFWRKADIGRHKVDVLAEALSDRFDNINIEREKRHVDIDEIKELLECGYDGLVVTADSPPTMVSDCGELAEHCGIPVVSGGYMHRNCVAKFFDGLNSSVEQINAADYKPREIASWHRLPCSVMPSFGPTNFNLAAMLAGALVGAIAKRCLRGVGQNIIYWDANSFLPVFHTTENGAVAE